MGKLTRKLRKLFKSRHERELSREAIEQQHSLAEHKHQVESTMLPPH